MASVLRLAASWVVPGLQKPLHQGKLRYQIARKPARINRKPTAVRHSRFFLYCAKENEATDSTDNFAGFRPGRKSGTMRTDSSKEASWRMCNSLSSRRMRRAEKTTTE